MFYVYESMINWMSSPFSNESYDYITEHIVTSKFVTATDDINKILAKTTGATIHPKQLKWNGKGTLILTAYGDSWSLGKVVIICCSESAVEKFEMQVLKNNLLIKSRRQNDNLFNTVVIDANIRFNSKEKEKRLLSTKYSIK